MSRHYCAGAFIYDLHAVDQKSIPLFSKIQPWSLLALNVWNYETGSNLAMNSGDKEDSHLDNNSFLKYLFS